MTLQPPVVESSNGLTDGANKWLLFGAILAIASIGAIGVNGVTINSSELAAIAAGGFALGVAVCLLSIVGGFIARRHSST